MLSRHRHIWTIQSQETQSSAWEQLSKGAKSLGQFTLPADGFDKPVIVTYKCAACGSQKVERV